MTEGRDDSVAENPGEGGSGEQPDWGDCNQPPPPQVPRGDSNQNDDNDHLTFTPLNFGAESAAQVQGELRMSTPYGTGGGSSNHISEAKVSAQGIVRTNQRLPGAPSFGPNA